MKSRFLFESRTKLLERLAQINAALAFIKSELAETANNQTNFLKDSIDHAAEQSDLVALIEQHERYQGQRNQIAKALERISNGHFGECINCCEEIPERRLIANPLAVLCLECQCQKEGHTGSVAAAVHKMSFVGAVPFFTSPMEVA